MRTYTLGSLFDGSGGFPLAGSLCGIEPLWASEVEPYPIAVTRSRFPNMKHLGDISKINGAEIPPVDIITFGSPCQDLSVAGKRAGLKHEDNGDEETTRSGLFMEAVRIIKEMRRATNGEYPKFAVWENVPGAFSSNKGEDFRIVLEELIKIVEPRAEMPSLPDKGKWPYYDCYMGDGWSLAYRTFDAQYWGVPQRRRRIHLVLDLRGERAEKILFEREGLRGYFETFRTAREEVTGDAVHSLDSADRERGNSCDGVQGAGLKREGECVALFQPMSLREENWAESNVRNALRAGESKASHAVVYGISSYESNAMKSSNPHSGIYEATTSRTLDLNGGNPACNQGGIVVVEPVRTYDIGEARLRTPSEYIEKTPTLTARCGTGGNHVPAAVYCLQGNMIGRDDKNGPQGDGVNEETSFTLNTTDRHAVAYMASGKETTGTLMASMATKQCLGDQEAFSGDYHVIEEREVEVFRQGGFAEYVQGECGTLRAAGGDYGGGTENLIVERPVVRYIVRRLTPTECARLQGFADAWGHPDHKDDFTDEEYRFWLDVRNTHAAINGKVVKDYTKAQMLTWYNKLHTDSSEYKMWGNGIALPPALYCMQGMVDALCG